MSTRGGVVAGPWASNRSAKRPSVSCPHAILSGPVSSNVGFEGGSVVEFDLASMKLLPATVGIFLLTLLGALFVVWPPASEATPRRVEPDAAAARISSPNLS